MLILFYVLRELGYVLNAFLKSEESVVLKMFLWKIAKAQLTYNVTNLF